MPNFNWVAYALPWGLFLAALLSGALAFALTVRYRLDRRVKREAELRRRTAEQARTKGSAP